MINNQSDQRGHAASHYNPLNEDEIEQLLWITSGDPHYKFLLLEQITAEKLAAAILVDKSRHPSNYSGKLWLKERLNELREFEGYGQPDWIVVAAAYRLEGATQKINTVFDIINKQRNKEKRKSQ